MKKILPTIVIVMLLLTTNVFSQPVTGNIYSGAKNSQKSFASIKSAMSYLSTNGVMNMKDVVLELNTGKTGNASPVTIGSVTGISTELNANQNAMNGKVAKKALSELDTLWTKSYGGEGKDEGYYAQQTTDGGYIIIGKTNSYGAGDFDAWLIKTDANGNILWTKTFGDTYIDEAYTVKQTTDGGYIIAGMSTAFGWAGEGWLIKTDENGNVIWSHGFHPTEGSNEIFWDNFNDVVETSDGGFIAIGVANSVKNMLQGWIVKVNSNGIMEWDYTYGAEYWERLYSIQPTPDGGYIAVGDKHKLYGDFYRHDGWLVKFNSNGDTLWTKTFGGEQHDIFRYVKQTSDGGYLISGERELTEQSGYLGWLVKTDENGNEIWNKTYRKGSLYSIDQVADGNYIVAGMTVLPQTAFDGWLLKIDGAGAIIWEKMVSVSSVDEMFLSMNRTTDGGYILGGKSHSNSLEGDLWLVKTNAEQPTGLTSFIEHFDSVTPPELPEGWIGHKEVLLSNTVAEVKTIPNGSAPSAPNATFIMNGLNGSNGQLDSTAFVAMISPLVEVGANGGVVTFWAVGGNPVMVGTMSDPTDASTFTLIANIPLTFDFTQYSVSLTNPGNTYIAFKNGNVYSVSPLFIDEITFEQATAPVTAALTITDINGINPGPVTIPVHAANISNMGSFQFTIDYDPAILTYVDVANWYPGIEAVTTGNPSPGHLTFVWAADAQGINIEDGNFFNLNFNWLTADVTTTNLTWSDNPTPREFGDFDGNIFVPEYVNGSETGFGVGIPETSAESVKVYPNPAIHSVSMIVPGNISLVQVINNTGTVVYSENILSNHIITLNTSGYGAGIYLVRYVAGNGKTFTKKLVVNK